MVCPICRRPETADYRPFCSRRCADVDLGRWITGSYAIPAEDGSDDDPERPDAPDPGSGSAPPRH